MEVQIRLDISNHKLGQEGRKIQVKTKEMSRSMSMRQILMSRSQRRNTML